MHCVSALLHTDIGRHGGCCAEVGYRPQMKIQILSRTFLPIADRWVPATENRRHMPAEYIGLQLRQSKKLTVVGCNSFFCYGKTTQYTIVGLLLHHGIPVHGISMEKTTLYYHVVVSS